jgi:hypothetical protein
MRPDSSHTPHAPLVSGPGSAASPRSLDGLTHDLAAPTAAARAVRRAQRATAARAALRASFLAAAHLGAAALCLASLAGGLDKGWARLQAGGGGPETR